METHKHEKDNYSGSVALLDTRPGNEVYLKCILQFPNPHAE